MNFVLGIDGGGSKTICILMNEKREILGRGEAGSSNYQSVGIETTKSSIESAIYKAIIKKENIQISAICLGLAGVGRAKDIEVIKSIVEDIISSQISEETPPQASSPVISMEETSPQPSSTVISMEETPPQPSSTVISMEETPPQPSSTAISMEETPPQPSPQAGRGSFFCKNCNIIISDDALIALVGGIGNDVGIVVAAGTGSIIFGRNYRGETKRVGGWGYILGDEGGAYKIAVAGMEAALRAYDGRLVSTSLVEDFKNHLGLSHIEELIEVVYRRGLGVKEIAALAPIVDSAAASGDKVANQIIDNAVEELVKATVTVINGIFSGRESREVVTTGSVWKSKSKMWERFNTSINKKFPEVEVILPRFEAVYGAGLLALKSLRK